MNKTLREALRELEDAIDRFGSLTEAAHPSLPAAEVRWRAFDEQIGRDLSGRRVLVVGSTAPADANECAVRGAAELLACDTPGALEAHRDQDFDVVVCNNVLHRVMEPMALLRTLGALTTHDGTLLIGAMVLGDPERSEFLRFVPDSLAGDPGYWFVPGRLSFRWMVEAAGFQVEAEFGEHEGPRDAFPVVGLYLRATPKPPGQAQVK